jgi:hypothetical protein
MTQSVPNAALPLSALAGSAAAPAAGSPEDVFYEPVHPDGITVLRHHHGANLVLQVVPMPQVIPHERFHGQRVADLAARMVADGRLINPPLAVAHKGKYVILDGATRFTVFQHLGYPHIILQVVDLDKQQVELQTWCHVVRGGQVGQLLQTLERVPGLALRPQPLDQLQRAALAPTTPGYLITADGRGFELGTIGDSGIESGTEPGTEPGNWVEVLNRMVDAYGLWGNVDRTVTVDLDLLTTQYPDLAALVVFPQFTPAMILEWAVQGRTVPAGITRFIVPGRILRLNAPLAMLAADLSLADKRRRLDQLVRAKLADRQVRYYEEPVVLLDE